jgi:aspartyl protease family protein
MRSSVPHTRKRSLSPWQEGVKRNSDVDDEEEGGLLDCIYCLFFLVGAVGTVCAAGYFALDLLSGWVGWDAAIGIVAGTALTTCALIAFIVPGSRAPLRNGAALTAVFLLLITGYVYRVELEDVWDRVSSELASGANGNRIVLKRSRNGHFYIVGRVNGTPVRFLIDTGATYTKISRPDAVPAKIDVRDLDFSIQTLTANGIGYAARTKVKLEIGGRTFSNATVFVGKNKQSYRSLLGMSTLKLFRKVQIRGDELILEW